MISLFGENLLSEYKSGNLTGLCYTDSEYDTGLGKEKRESGFIPGKVMSAVLLNTALKQYCAMSYVITDVIKNILQNYWNWTSEQIETYFTDFDNTKIETIVNAFCDYLYQIRQITNEPAQNETVEIIPVHTARNYSTDGAIAASMNEVAETIDNYREYLQRESDLPFDCNVVARNYLTADGQRKNIKNTFDELDARCRALSLI